MLRIIASRRFFSTRTPRVCSVLGSQWGDEGKGKLVDILAAKFDYVARFNGGANAGHTLVVNKQKFAFHLLPCGLLYPDKLNIIGPGVVLHVPTLREELRKLDAAGVAWRGRLLISDRTHLLFDFHQKIDGIQETQLGSSSIGTTKRGIGPCYASKMTRNGIRVGELKDMAKFEAKYRALVDNINRLYRIDYDPSAELALYKDHAAFIKPLIRDTTYLINEAIGSGKTLLAEGANAAMLDIDHGTYPYVTSSATSAGGICTGLGIAPSKVEQVIGVVKAYTTRVGSGPFPTELLDETGETLRKNGHEFGTTTGRPRRCGWLDVPVVQYSDQLNDYNAINITKLDVLTGLSKLRIGVSYSLDGELLPGGLMPGDLADYSRVTVNYEEMPGWNTNIANCRQFADLPKEARDYLNRVEQLIKKPIKWIGVGPGREDMIVKQ